jgi:GNAT superfamily N-acetyltransferase
MRVHSSSAEDEQAVAAFLDAHGAARIARLGELVDALAHPHLIAREDDSVTGVLTYVIRGGECEILTLHAEHRLQGTGTALIEAVKTVAQRAGCTRLWLMTTNDNVDALRFYQRRGFRLVKLHADAVDHSRTRLKPEIPRTGNYGIALRDELELEAKVQSR